MTVRRRVARRLERAILGTVMSVIASIIERRVLKTVRGTGAQPPQPAREGESGRAGNDPAGQAWG